ncbi:hypothetical protein [Mesorhizobium sp. INR15]|uniref:hypothetical protein n=1 Tax=Mesorhizobium sp. INR15 TaxID=2654248 RepID=UPI0018964D17|nr:hypothetical protein [Mesorhizobium sp. INR15]QPC93277.1 hypothetical protein GA829_23400 [Mesorhizobium sp. INR15]
MIHIPLSDNRIAQFEARFETYQDGYVYYGDSSLGGLPLSAQERDRYVTNFVTILRRGNRVMLCWIILAAVGLLIAEVEYSHSFARWQQAIVFLMPFPWVLLTWRRSTRLVLDEIGGRTSVTPPRGYLKSIHSRVAAFPPALPLTMIGIGALLLVQLWRYGDARNDISGVALGLGVIGFGIWIFWVKRKVKWSGQNKS